MGGTARSIAVTGGVLAFLLAVGCSADRTATTEPGSRGTDVGVAGVEPTPTLRDNSGVPLAPAHAEVVRAVHAALAVGDLNALRELYTGADWAGQAQLLEQPSVRSDVLTVLRTHPANLGEGYVYPGFSTTGWAGPLDRADATVLGLTPESLPNPVSGYGGYQTAFFLAPEDGGPLQWRGIDAPPDGLDPVVALRVTSDVTRGPAAARTVR